MADNTDDTGSEVRAAEAEAAEAEATALAARQRAQALQRRLNAAGDTDTAGPDDPPAPDAHAGRPVSRRRRITGALAAAVVGALLVCCALMVVQHHRMDQQRQRAAEFMAAARQGVITMTSMDFAHAEADVQRVLDNSTGEFRDDFERRAQDFITTVQKTQVVTEGVVTATAIDIDSMTRDSAVVLVTASSTVTNLTGAEQAPRAWRLRVVVTRDSDELKMSKLEFVL